MTTDQAIRILLGKDHPENYTASELADARELGARALLELPRLRLSLTFSLNGVTDTGNVIRAARDAMDLEVWRRSEIPKCYTEPPPC